MGRAAAWVASQAPLRLMSSTSSNSSSFIWIMSLSLVMPALFTRMCRAPWRSSTVFTAAPDAVAVAHVQQDVVGLAAVGLDGGDHLLQVALGGGQGGADGEGALLGQLAGDDFADALAGAGDEGDLAFE